MNLTNDSNLYKSSFRGFLASVLQADQKSCFCRADPSSAEPVVGSTVARHKHDSDSDVVQESCKI